MAMKNIVLKMLVKGGEIMRYEKPVVTKVEVSVKVNTEASDRSSCEGGHCVKARYEQDH